MPRTLVLLCAVLLAACGGPSGECIDLDVDGYGPGCALGDDCDDTNALRIRGCEDLPELDCSADPTLTGCPCLPGTAACYDAPRETSGVAMCQPGVAICINQHWGLCGGAVLPASERCNGEDDDCDGDVDEGATSPCGGCTPGCIGGVWGEGADPFEAGADTDVTARGRLTLRFEETSRQSVWIANSGEDTVSHIDDATAREVGRYVSGGSEPSRVAVDYRGDAWVTNRTFGGVGSVRKIAGDLERCVDVDESGSIDTSEGSEVVVGDECVLLTAAVGGLDEVPRALAIDGNLGVDGATGGDPWVGLYEGQAIVHLDAVTGAVRRRIETPEFQPYALAFDRFGVLWGMSKDGYLLSLDRHDPDAEPLVREIPLACFSLYGLAIDGRDRVVLTGFECDQVTLYDPVTDRYQSVSTPPSVRGAVVRGAFAYVAHTDGRLSEIRLDPLEVAQTFSLAPALDSIGVGATERGLWVASGVGGPGDDGLATRVDPSTGDVVSVVVGRTPHTQGDLTGAKLLGAFVPEGRDARVFEGCADDATRWRSLHVSAVAGGGTVSVSVRHAASTEGLASAAFEERGEADGPDVVFPLDLPEGGVVEVELVLRAGSVDGAPRVRRVGIEWQCPGPD